MEGEPGVLSAVPAGRREERLALGVVLFSALVFAALAPFAKEPLGRAPAFVPMYQAALFLNDLITAALLYAQCRVSRSRPLFILACGYLFTASMTVAHTLSFPGLFAPQGVIGGGVHSTAWIYMFWHAVFPLFVGAYALAGDRRLSGGQAALGIGGAIALAALLTAAATGGARWLPEIMNGDGYLPAYHAVVGAVWFCSLGALLCVWVRRPRTLLDLWVMVVMCVWIFEIALAAVLNAGRFDLGFYAGRIYGLAAASFVLCVLVFETSGLHARLAAAAAEREARVAAEAANRAKDQFLAVLSHELRNPLAPIVTSLELMRRRDPNAHRPLREVIERQIGHLTRLVEDLLDVSRLARGAIEMRVTRCEAADIVARALEMAQPLVQSRQHKVEVEAPRGLELEADVERMAQVLSNLLGNSAKFTAPGGRIAVTAAREDGEIVFRVSDDGAGIPPELQARLFQPFMQGAQSSARPLGGLGLGLAIVKNLVALHGGTVEARSEGAGRGAEFIVRLGAASRQALPSTNGEIPRPEPLPRSQVRRVLIVDDNVDAAASLAQALAACGIDVREANDAKQAIATAAWFKPQVGLLDLGLPDIDGYELAARLRALPGLAELRLAALTGYGQPDDRARTSAAGFNAHFVKPVQNETLLAFLGVEEPAPG